MFSLILSYWLLTYAIKKKAKRPCIIAVIFSVITLMQLASIHSNALFSVDQLPPIVVAAKGTLVLLVGILCCICYIPKYKSAIFLCVCVALMYVCQGIDIVKAISPSFSLAFMNWGFVYQSWTNIFFIPIEFILIYCLLRLSKTGDGSVS